ncbi:MAG: protein kinase [Anaerolineae bacterium]|nr:protein kinase [Anaerolineae bacterium]
MNTVQNFPNLSKYRALEVLGQGRFATVYKVEDATMGRLMAVKVFDGQLMQDELWVPRFSDRVRAIARLQHPHIVTVYEVDSIDGQLYAVMQLAHEGSLAHIIAAHSGQPMPWSKVLAFMKAVCDALAYAHEQSMAHGDLKPSNILVDSPGGPLLTDFGLTRLMATNSVGRTRLEGGIVGTLPYAAPEVWESEPAEIPSDIYALGCITYEMLLGRQLFVGDTMMQAMHSHAQGPQFPSAWPSGTPAHIEAVLRTALAWDPTARYPDAKSFWNALNTADTHAGVSTGAKLAAATVAAAAQWGAKVEAALQSGKLQLAKMAVNQWLAAEPDNPDAVKARDSIERQIASVTPAPAPKPQVHMPVPPQAQPVVQPAPQPTPAPQPAVQPTPTSQPTPAQTPVAPIVQPSAPQPAVPATQPPAPPTPFSFYTLPDHQSGVLCNQYTVDQFVSTEGQLSSHCAEIGGQEVTLRWFFQTEATPENRAVLEALLNQGPPAPGFLWPAKMIESADVPGFGYVMAVRDSRFKSLDELVKRWVDPTFNVLTTTLLGLVDAFTALHLKGLCFSDISPRSFSFDPDTGEICIVYSDNIVTAGTTGIVAPEELRFMAPEIVREEAAPSQQSDLYSLAVLLFYILMVHHPLEGERATIVPTLDRTAVQRIYGTDPVFIFDPSNASNRPVPGYHVHVNEYWPIYPQAIRDMFVRAFTTGIADSYGGRIRESEWRKALVALRDTIIYCAQCGSENFYDLAVLKSTGTPGVCWSCKTPLTLPPRLRMGDDVTMLNYNTRLYVHHVDPDRLYDFSQIVAEVTQHPQNPSIWGLKNLGSEKWVITTDDGTIKDVMPGRSLTLSAGVKINFGKKEGEIRV